MKRILFIIAAVFAVLPAFAQDYVFTEAADLTIVGKVFPGTPSPYKRLDFDRYPSEEWSKGDRSLLDMSDGIAVAFRTNSPSITVKSVFEVVSGRGASCWGTAGYDLYIKKDGRWLWAGDAYVNINKDRWNENLKVVTDMDASMKECLLYFPTFSTESSVKIGVEDGSVIEALPNPFRHKIVIYGSSFMHGATTSRAGATVQGFLMRGTGLEFRSFAMSGNAKMQPRHAVALADAEADAFLCDAFSNPDPEEIRDRLFPFIEKLQAAHPGVPIIFMSSIYREYRNFNLAKEKWESEKRAMADSMMRVALKRYKDVYYIESNATSPDHETTVDGIHPSDAGYRIWAESLRKPLLRILRKYGVR